MLFIWLLFVDLLVLSLPFVLVWVCYGRCATCLLLVDCLFVDYLIVVCWFCFLGFDFRYFVLIVGIFCVSFLYLLLMVVLY